MVALALPPRHPYSPSLQEGLSDLAAQTSANLGAVRANVATLQAGQAQQALQISGLAGQISSNQVGPCRAAWPGRPRPPRRPWR